MSQQPSGWYDDPSNPDMLRYWDGVTWTNHTAPRKSPTLPQGTGVPPARRPRTPGAAATQGVPIADHPDAAGQRVAGPGAAGLRPGDQPGQFGQPAQYGQEPQYPGAPANAAWMQ